MAWLRRRIVAWLLPEIERQLLQGKSPLVLRPKLPRSAGFTQKVGGVWE
jgi:hypothetical protein